jgi:hypothetical protein
MMGEYADYMLNGDDCQECGEYIGDGPGYPRSCAGCRAAARREKPASEQPFFIRKSKDLAALETWLKARELNCFGFVKNDRNGNPMIGIGHGQEKRGLVIVIDRLLRADVERLIERMKAP